MRTCDLEVSGRAPGFEPDKAMRQHGEGDPQNGARSGKLDDVSVGAAVESRRRSGNNDVMFRNGHPLSDGTVALLIHGGYVN